MPAAEITYIAPYPTLLIVLLIGALIVARRDWIVAYADGMSSGGFIRSLMRFVARGVVLIGWVWLLLAVFCIVLKLAGPH